MRSTIIPFIFLWMVSNGQRIEVPQLNSQCEGQTAIGSAQVDLPYNPGVFLITPLPEVTNRISKIFPSLLTTSVRKNFQLPGSQISTNREISNLDISSISTNGQLSHLPIPNNGETSRGQFFVSTTPSTFIDQIQTIFPTLPSSGRRKFLTASSPISNYKGAIFNLPNSQISVDSPISINRNNLPESPILNDRKIPSVSDAFSIYGERLKLSSTPISTNRDRLSQSPISVNREISRPSYSQFSAKGDTPVFNISPIQNSIDTPTSVDRISNGGKFDTISSPISNSIDTRTSFDKISNHVQTDNTSLVDVQMLTKLLAGVPVDPNKSTQLHIKAPGNVPLSVTRTPTAQYLADKISNHVQTDDTSLVDVPMLTKLLAGVPVDPNKQTQLHIKAPGKVPLSVTRTPTAQYLADKISNHVQTDDTSLVDVPMLTKLLAGVPVDPNKQTQVYLKAPGKVPLSVTRTPTAQYLADKISNNVQTEQVDLTTLNKTLQGVQPDPNKPTHVQITAPGQVPLSVKITRTDQYLADEWAAFKKKYNKVYSSDQEDSFRKGIFMENTVKITNYNEMYSKGLVGYSSKMNNYGDMLNDEFNKHLNGFDATDILDERVNPRGSSYIRALNINLPDHVDWRLKGAVTPVKSQGTCQSCYAFAAAGALEGQYYRRHGMLKNLSAQEIIDCSTPYNNMGCNTGRMSKAYIYIREAGGIRSEKIYGYEGKNGECRHQTDDYGASSTGYMTLTRLDEGEMQVALAANGPIAAAIDAGQPTFQFFGSGIYDDPKCNSKPSLLNHAILIIGYGQEPDGKKYWLVKNTYGTNWGENGYIKIARDVNQCGISTETSFPLV